jgi:TolA-binding protein
VKKLFIFLVLFGLGLHYGYTYLFSDDFQRYADRTKQPWTCHANNLMGHFAMLMSHYDEALHFFEKVPERCPESRAAEDAEFQVAKCLEVMGRVSQALAAYQAYGAAHPNTKRGRIAIRAAQIIQPS